MSQIDSYLRSLKFIDGQPTTKETTFVKVSCTCGAVYATRISLFSSDSGTGQAPMSDKSILESMARCPECDEPLTAAASVSMFVSGGFATRPVKGYLGDTK